jgi:hypothetical protein
VGRIFVRGLIWVVLVAAALWVSDWLLWQGRMLGGGGYGVVGVDRFVVAPLKNNKEEVLPGREG